MAETEVEDSDLSAIVASELRQAQTFDQSKRALAIQYMRGEMPDLPPRPNGSKQTSRDVADTISWILPGVMRVFTASDQMVQFDATQEGGEQGAEEASEYTNYSFFRENDGYHILYNATHDSLLMGNGAACSYWCPEESETKLYRNKLPEEIAELLNEGWKPTGAPPIHGTPRMVEQQDPVTGDTVEVEAPTMTVRLQLVTKRAQISDMTLKPENLMIVGGTTIENSRTVAYLHDDWTRSDALEMADEYGWDKQVIDDLPRFALVETVVDDVRRRVLVEAATSSPVKSGDTLGIHEVYIKADQDGDGIAERLRVWFAGTPGGGGVILGEAEEWEDDIPFTDIPCYPVPHQWEAESVFDREADIQRVKTTLLRQALDNTYAVNMPMQEVEEGSVLNPDILVNRRFGGLIWKKKASLPIVPQVVPYIADKAFAALEYMDTITAKRTGVSKTTMALDPETLQNQTATGSQLQHDAGYSQIELIARNQAELGWAKFFAKRRNLAKKYLKGTLKVPSKNGDAPPPPEPMQPQSKPSNYRTVQPEQWSDDMACTINVGLGTGSRDRDMSMLNLIINGQTAMADRLGAAGFVDKAIEFIPRIRKTAVEMAESSGLRNPDDYYPTITDEEVAAMKQQAQQRAQQPPLELTLQQMKQQSDERIQQSEAQSNQMKAQAETMKSQAEAQVKQLEAQLAAQKQQFEAMMAQEELHIKQLEISAKNETELKKAAWSNLTSLEIARISASKDTATEPGPVEAELENIVGISAAQNPNSTGAKLDMLHKAVTDMHQTLNAPTEIVRGPDGKAVGARKVTH